MLFNLNRGVFDANSFAYTGTYEWLKVGNEWMMALKSSGTLTLKKTVARADLCIVAGGQKGQSAEANGGKGGKGGEVKNVTEQNLPSGTYTVTIGTSDQNSFIVGNGVNLEAATAGGSGGGGNGNSGKNGGDGAFPWNDQNTLLCMGWRFGAGGGRGGYVNDSAYQYTGDPGSGGSVGNASPGTTNGKGGLDSHKNGYPGLTNAGQGGGGPYYKYSSGSGSVTSNGGSGIILIRPHKEVST